MTVTLVEDAGQPSRMTAIVQRRLREIDTGLNKHDVHLHRGMCVDVF